MYKISIKAPLLCLTFWICFLLLCGYIEGRQPVEHEPIIKEMELRDVIKIFVNIAWRRRPSCVIWNRSCAPG